nr:SDR family NAD(P)-dependent oxidoreductase [Bacteroidota bacterium]
MERLKNKVAIITGGADGIGKATAIKFASEGAITLIWDVQEEKGRNTVEEITKNNGKAEFIKVDTTQYDQVEDAVEDAIEKYGSIDILIN